LGVACSRHQKLAGNGGEKAGSFLILILHAFGPAFSVKRYGKRGEDRIKGIADGGIVCGKDGAAARIFDYKGVGYG
jgi:hypothetical protein